MWNFVKKKPFLCVPQNKKQHVCVHMCCDITRQKSSQRVMLTILIVAVLNQNCFQAFVSAMCWTSCSLVLKNVYTDMIYRTQKHDPASHLPEHEATQIIALNYGTHPASQTRVSWCQRPPSCILSNIICSFLWLHTSAPLKKKNPLEMRMFVQHLPAFQTMSLDSPKTLPLKNN